MKHTHTFSSLLLIGLLLTLHSLPTVQAATNCAAVTEIPKAQCDTLVALYNSTGGANWTNKAGWNETNTPCSWYGITCGGNIIKVDMGNNNLKGSLPDLSALTGLQILFLSQNQLTGTIPDLSQLTHLQTLSLYQNQLTGTIPDLSKLTSLRFLVLPSNQLTGTIPDLSKLTSLQYLSLHDNQLTGTIPDLSQLTSLQTLHLFQNQLTGTIPDLSQLIRLQTISLFSNQLTGTIPDLSQLTSLQYLNWYNNQLTGTIPDLSKLTALRELYLAGNQLIGTIPDLNKLTSLQTLSLLNNQFTGTIPDLSNLVNLEYLYLNNNQLKGTIPDLSQLTKLRSIYLHNNQLTGTIPDLGKLISLRDLQLQGNQLTGTIPDLSKLTNLQYLYLNNNQLTGAISDLSQLTSLRVLYLSSNQLTGTIPDLSQLTSLQYLHWYNNQLTGTIPDLSKLTSLQTLRLNDNQLSGPIPSLNTLTKLTTLYLSNNPQLCRDPNANYGTRTEVNNFPVCPFSCNNVTQIPQAQCNTLLALYNSTGGVNWTTKTGWNETNTPCSWYGITCSGGNVSNIKLPGNNLKGSLPDLSALTELQILYLFQNQLTGIIPDLSRLTSLQQLSLWSNQLTGTIPDFLSNLTSLQRINLSINQLTGTIPDLTKLVNLQYLFLNNNQLTSTIPADLGKLTGLRHLYLGGNKLTGTIPDLSQLANLQYLYLNNGQLTGTIPDWSKLTNLETLLLNDNQLSGPIPSLNTLTKLTSFQLSNNPQLCKDPNANYGTRTEVNSFPVCTSLIMTITKTGTGIGEVKTADTKINCGTTCQGNYAATSTVTLTAISSTGSTFTGWSGDCTGTDTSITLTMNAAKTCTASFATVPTSCPTGDNTSSVVTLPPSGPNISTVNSSETISSSVPLPEYPFCAQVTEIPKTQCQNLLAIYDNTNGNAWTHQNGWNTTTTPCQWYGVECTLGQVTALRLANNNLQGTLPTLAALTFLKQLAVEDNLLKGTLSGLPTTLTTFTGDRNQLSGPLTVLQPLTQLRELSLSNNQLGDALPDLGQLTQLELLNLNNNQLVGPIPDLHKLTQLKQLLLKDNHLAGAIPVLTVVETLDLNGNDQLCRDLNLTYTQPALTAYPPCTYPTLTVAKTGSGIGLVSATSPTDKDKLTCGQECIETNQAFAPDSTVTLTATPTDGTVFTGWLGECNGDTATTTVTLDQAKTCVANFEIKAGYYELQVSKAGIGKGLVTTPNTNDPLHCDAKCQETRESYPAGTPITLRASASKGSTFTGWGGACSGTDPRITLTLDQAKSCYANFNLKEPPPPTMRQLIINTDAGNGNGTVTAIGIDCGIDCLENYREGINVKLTATPHAGSSFLGWEDDCGGKDPTLTVKMTDNKLCTAFFANDVEMVASETVTDFYANGYLDTGEEVKDRYPRYPDNDQRLQEAFSLAQPAILTVDLQVDVNDLDATWPIQFNDGISFFRLQPAGRYTESVKILKDAIVEGYLSPALVVGYYVEVRVKLLNYLGGEEWVPVLMYYGDAPTMEEVPGARSSRSFVPSILKAGIAYLPPPPPCPACRRPK